MIDAGHGGSDNGAVAADAKAAVDAITSGLEVTWTYHPARWDNEFFHILFGYEWELFKSPSNANQWRPKDNGGAAMVP